MALKVLDDYYLGLTALVTVAYQLFFFSIAYSCQFDLLTDLAGGTNFALISLTTLFLSGSPYHPRQIVATSLISLWALRLSSFLFYRILKTGHDTRFDGMRHRFTAFLGFWMFQMLWVWGVSLPVTLGNSPAVLEAQRGSEVQFGAAGDVVGVVMFGVGFAVEVVADGQRYAFRKKHGGGAAAVCDGGVWRFSRHPNYFGDILAQFGIYTIATTPTSSSSLPTRASAALYASIVGPFLITALLLFLSGLPLSERPTAKRRYELDLGWDEYSAYLRRTSPLVPFPPWLYEKVPVWLRRTLFMEFPMYVFVPERDSKVRRGEGKKDGGERRESEDEGDGPGPGPEVDVDGSGAARVDGREESTQESGPSTDNKR